MNNLKKALSLFYQLCDQLSILHNYNILHLDVGNRNILFFNDKIKLIDFGLAVKLHESENSDPSPLYSNRIADFRKNGITLDESIDIFWAGVFLLTMLLGLKNLSAILKEKNMSIGNLISLNNWISNNIYISITNHYY